MRHSTKTRFSKLSPTLGGLGLVVDSLGAFLDELITLNADIENLGAGNDKRNDLVQDTYEQNKQSMITWRSGCAC
jgi:hypothetical protein